MKFLQKEIDHLILERQIEWEYATDNINKILNMLDCQHEFKYIPPKMLELGGKLYLNILYVLIVVWMFMSVMIQKQIN
jgi:hypothetical protein